MVKLCYVHFTSVIKKDLKKSGTMRKIQQRILRRNDWRGKSKELWTSREEGIFMWRWCPVVPDIKENCKEMSEELVHCIYFIICLICLIPGAVLVTNIGYSENPVDRGARRAM